MRESQENFIGVGAAVAAASRIRAGGFRRPFVVASARAWTEFGNVAGEIFPGDARPVFFRDFSPNPSWSEVGRGGEAFRGAGADLVLAVGGGSAIDMAKMIRGTAAAPAAGTPEGAPIAGGGPPLAVFATTAGSGSEATPFAVCYVGDAKYSLDDPRLLPDVAVADPALCASMPPRLTAVAGFDALAQATESYWARRSTPESRLVARRALEHLLPNIERAVNDPDPESRLGMCLGANLAGRAIALTRTTAAHAFSYVMTKRFGIPHGHAAALTVPDFLRLNAAPGAESDFPGGEEARLAVMRSLFALFGCETAGDAAEFWRGLLRRCGLAATLPEAGVASRRDFEVIVDNVNLERLANNPVRVSRDGMLAAWAGG